MYQTQRVRIFFVLAALLASPFLTTRAHAATIDLQTIASQTLCAGMASCMLSDGGLSLTLTAVSDGTHPTLAYKTVAGEPGLGVSAASNDRTPGEIDPNESIDGALNSPWVVESFKLMFIYNGPEFEDPNEIAEVKVWFSDGSDGTYTFTVSSVDNQGIWTGPSADAIESCGDTDLDGSGCFEFTKKPFGDKPITGFSFTAIFVENWAPNNSDYSLGAFEFSAPPEVVGHDATVPEPGSMLLLGSGLLAMGRAASRRRRK